MNDDKVIKEGQGSKADVDKVGERGESEEVNKARELEQREKNNKETNFNARGV